MAEVRSGREMSKSGLPKPLLGGSEADGPEEGSELQHMELHNMDLQANLIQQSGEVAKLKISERELKHKVSFSP